MPISTSKGHDAAAVKDAIRQKAHELGFEAVGFTGGTLHQQHKEALTHFIELGYHGDMAWMADRLHHRTEPQALWPNCKSVIMLGMNYGPDHNPLDVLSHTSHGAISVYAQGDDYHDVIKKKLKAVGRWMAESYGTSLKVFVDTAPVAEKRLAEAAGLGWQGKHTNLVSRDFGSWLFLGAIFTDFEMEIDEPHNGNCGSCTACLDICPTNAFPAPFTLDARKCLSYLTIEYKGAWPEEFREAMGNRIYGCDDCLAICPWNKFAKECGEAKLEARPDIAKTKLADMLALDDTGFRALFRKNPVKRIGVNQFLRNCLYAAGNSGDQSLLDAIIPHLNHDDAVVKDAAKWAQARLTA